MDRGAVYGQSQPRAIGGIFCGTRSDECRSFPEPAKFPSNKPHIPSNLAGCRKLFSFAEYPVASGGELHLPPLLHTADVLAFSPYTDALLLVVEEGKTTAEEVQRFLLPVKNSHPVL